MSDPNAAYQPPPPPQGGWPPPPPRGPYGPYYSPPEPTEPPAGPPPTPPARPSHRSSWAILAVVVAGAVLLSGLGVGWGMAASRAINSVVSGVTGTQNPIRTVPQQNGTSNGASGQTLDVQAITDKVGAATVDINTVIASLNGSAQAAGTGMILTSNGEVLTNNHVVEGAKSIKVTIPGRSNTYTATVVGVSPSADVALIQVQGVSGLPTVTLADSSTLSIGQPVVAMGNALGQGGAPSVTQGSITALDQTITASSDNGSAEQLTGLIQSDASISPGDSGGPLVNSSGQVIGMITAGEAQGFRRSTSTTVGYAIPSNNAVSVVNEIRAGHASSSVLIGQTGYLGVSVANLDARTAARLGLDVSGGALVRGVEQGSPADKIGLAANAVITAIDGKTISSADDLSGPIQGHKPGEKIKVTWVDQSGTHTATATLIAGPAA
ncbi:MAG TPA: trypsin-like peptidase domain-containing protein [Candidatus Dormibacteraeota bacterium]|nr:trypsin-like peptidase domain-containing protein [Candidatus Dormibacteraeota bacterium]